MLTISEISKVLPNGKCLLNRVSFMVSKGEFVSILGLSGAGKTMILRCVIGLTKPDEGEVSLCGVDGARYKTTQVRERDLRRARRHMALIFQGSNLVKRLSVIDNVMLGRLGYVHPLRSWTLGFHDSEARDAMEALDQVNMADFAGRQAGSLSGGEMQRVAIARAIHQKPLLYLVDEPISSLDPKNAESIMSLLQPLSRETPILGAFHQPAMVARYCTRAIGLRQGSVVYDGAAKLSDSDLERIYGDRRLETNAGLTTKRPPVAPAPFFTSEAHA